VERISRDNLSWHKLRPERRGSGEPGGRHDSPEDLSGRVCPICRGTRHLVVPAENGGTGIVPCECQRRERGDQERRRRQEMSNLDGHDDKTFASFNPRVPGVEEAYEAARDYAGDPRGWLVIVGPPACGKTHLAAAVAHQVLASGRDVIFAPVPQLMERLRKAYKPDAALSYDEYIEAVRTVFLLVLDDLDTQRWGRTPWAREKLYQVLNYRYNHRLPTAVTTRDLDSIEERVRSRVCDWRRGIHVLITAGPYGEGDSSPRERQTKRGWRHRRRRSGT
jgi:DNA replication protein DnaC